MAYCRVTQEERRLIYRWRQEGYGVREIGRLLARSAGSISREIERNCGRKGYRFKQAHWKAVQRAKRSGVRRFTDDVREVAERQIREGWTPEMISGRAKLQGRPAVCKETIYKHVYADARNGGDLWGFLPRARRKRHKRCPKVAGRGRGRIPNQKMIDTLSVKVETRQSVGHWEGDLINGAHGTGHLITLVERKTRFTLVGRVHSKETEEVVDAMVDMMTAVPRSAKETLTLDNGKEFARHESFSLQSGLDVYFAHPYHSWERGTNENTNGLVRRLHPKKTSFADIDHKAVCRIERFLNDRPRKCLEWKTPREVMAVFLGLAP